MRLLGYADRLSVEPGQDIEFKVSCELEHFRPTVVRLLRGGSPSIGTSVVEQPVATDLDETYPGRVQTASAGSYLDSALVTPVQLRGLGLSAWVCPTTPNRVRPQAVLSLASSDGTVAFTLALTAQGCALLGSKGQVLGTTDVALVERQWCFVAATMDDDGGLTLTQARVGGAPVTKKCVVPLQARPAGAVDRLSIAAQAARGNPDSCFNGKLARPVAAISTWDATATERLRLGDDPADVLSGDAMCAFDFAGDQASLRVDDRGELQPGAHS